MTPWHRRYHPAPLEELRRVGSAGWEVFVRQSDAITEIVERKLTDHVHAAKLRPGGGRVLDFGAGIGRIALNLSARRQLPTDACDINPAAISYLASQLPQVSCHVTDEMPPLPHEDGTFDAVYAISVWTHLALEPENAWLEEMRRILKPGGVLLASICGPAGVETRQALKFPNWPYDREELEREGRLFLPYHNNPQPGITNSYGLSAHSHDYLARVWDRIMPIEAVYPRSIDGIQDLVVLRRGSGD